MDEWMSSLRYHSPKKSKMMEKSIQSFQCPEVLGIRRQVPLLDGRRVEQVFLDNAASTKAFAAVGDFLEEILPYYSNIHRGTGFDSTFCTERYEEAREIIGKFVGYDPEKDVVVPVRNTTEGLNLLAHTIPFEPGDRVITTTSEHHSDDLPWRSKAKVDYIPCDGDGKLQLDKLEELLNPKEGRVRVVSVTGASNVTGIVTPIHNIATLAHNHGAIVIVDGAQLIPHRSFDMRAHGDLSHIDFVVFSGHKMNCPFGVGAVVGRRDIFADAPPYQSGGGTVHSVSLDHIIWAEPPEKQEAGTPNIPGILALARGIQIMEAVGMSTIEEREKYLTELMLEGLSSIPGVEIFGSADPEIKVGVVSFRIPRLHHALVGAILSYEWGIAVRHGCFCAHPLVKQLLHISREQEREFEEEILEGVRVNVPGAVRASLGIHNTEEDVERLVEAVSCIARGQWQGKYHQEQSSGEFLPQNFRFDFDQLPGFATPPPQKSRKPKLARNIRPFYAAASLLFFALGGIGGWWLRSQELDKIDSRSALASDITPTPVQTIAIVPETVLRERTFTGTVEPVESVTLTTRVRGRIERLSVQLGDVVQAGEAIAVVEVRDIQAQRSRAAGVRSQREAALTQARAAKMTAQSQMNQVLWRRNETEAKLQEDRAQLVETQAELERIEAELTEAKRDRNRMKSLQAGGAVSQSLLDEANTRVAVISARRDQTQASIDRAIAIVKQTEARVKQAIEQVRQSKAEVARAEAGVKEAEALVAQATAEWEGIGAELSYSTVVAPFTGIVTQKQAEVGAIAGPGQPLVTLESKNRLRFTVEIPGNRSSATGTIPGCQSRCDRGYHLRSGRSNYPLRRPHFPQLYR